MHGIYPATQAPQTTNTSGPKCNLLIVQILIFVVQGQTYDQETLIALVFPDAKSAINKSSSSGGSLGLGQLTLVLAREISAVSCGVSRGLLHGGS